MMGTFLVLYREWKIAIHCVSCHIGPFGQLQVAIRKMVPVRVISTGPVPIAVGDVIQVPNTPL